MGKIKLAFTDFWKDFNPQDNWFYRFLSTHFEIELSDDPDFLIYSNFGYKYLNYNCVKIFYTGENIRPNYYECDFALSSDFSQRNNHFRLPLYGIWDGLEPERLLQPTRDDILSQKTSFCCMLVSNAQAKERIRFFHKLSKYKKVDSGGRYLNNIGAPVADKISFMEPYKFTIAFENSSYPGYVTEKIYQPMFMQTIPIYWGSPNIGRDFNTDSFVNWHDYGSDEAVIERIIELDQNDDLYLAMLSEPWFSGNQVNEYVDRENIRLFFEKIFQFEGRPIAQTWKRKIGWASRKTRSLSKKLKRRN
jgi:alpha(1,3/1,4) fucosyltransferase